MKTIVAGALGECVHVAGVMNFLRLAEAAGWRAVFLGPAVPVEDFLKAAKDENADLVGVSYRLTPETGERLLADFAEEADELRASGVRFAFGGTPPMAERARALGFFERVFEGGEAAESVLAYLKGQSPIQATEQDFPQTTIERMRWKSPYPLLRHHFGLPTLEETRLGIEKIAAAGALDVISLGIDQDAQENFFHPERQDLRRKGAGGVPVRSADDYRALFAASRRGNYPLMRTYSGTDDFIQLAELYVETIQNAWCAIPLFWFNQMDGRGPWNLEGSIREHQQVMAWYGAHNIPVELNEPHHWGMRDAPDSVCVASAFLAAYNARAFGVKDYIAQLMFNSPPGLSDAMDLAKMLAVLELIEPLAGPNFRIWKQTRTGLLSYPLDPTAARAHLAASVYVQMALKPDIVHIVGHTEADHAATAEDVIEACGLARRSIENAVQGAPDMTEASAVQARVKTLVAETKVLLRAIQLASPSLEGATHRSPPTSSHRGAHACEPSSGTNPSDESVNPDGSPDPWTDPAALARAVTLGILDAPQLRSNPFGRGDVRTRILKGACVAVGPDGAALAEGERLAKIVPGDFQ